MKIRVHSSRLMKTNFSCYLEDVPTRRDARLVTTSANVKICTSDSFWTSDLIRFSVMGISLKFHYNSLQLLVDFAERAKLINHCFIKRYKQKRKPL